MHAVLAHCARRPGAVGYRRFGETAFRVGHRTFAFADPAAGKVTVKVPWRSRRRLLARGAVVREGLVGRLGWVTVLVADERSVDLARRLVDCSYARAAPAPTRAARSAR